MFGYTSVSNAGAAEMKGVEIDIESGERLYPGIGHGENQLRWGFIRKVYGILAAQILMTTAVSAATVLYAPLNDLLRGNSGFLLFLVFTPFLLLWPLYVYQQKHPLNFIFLGLFTASLSLTVGVTCANTEGRIVLEALIMTSAVVMALTGYTFWASKKGKDFSFLGPVLFTSLFILVLTSFMAILNMELQGSDIHIDKEPDGVIVYSNGDNRDSTYPNPSQQDPSLSCDFPILDAQLGDSTMDGNAETKHCEIKECNTKNSVEFTKPCHVETYEKDILSFDSETNGNDRKSTSDDKTRARDERTAENKCTVPQPCVLTTKKSVGVTGDVQSHDHILQKKSFEKQNPKVSTVIPRRPLQPTNKKHLDEDTCSLDSSNVASIGKIKATAAAAPVFKSSERAEKRKEFFSKLEEKHNAMEAEKTQCEARTKEETEAAIKQLRKSLMFKASPMPSFYHEGPPPKVELKKAPPTRAKSPKLGRRKGEACQSFPIFRDIKIEEKIHGDVAVNSRPTVS